MQTLPQQPSIASKLRIADVTFATMPCVTTIFYAEHRRLGATQRLALFSLRGHGDVLRPSRT